MKTILFCLPYGGGSATVYHSWKKDLHRSIELVPLELAGRGRRFVDPFYRDLDEAVDDIYQMIIGQVGHSSYSIFGHSMGALLAFECAHRLRIKNQRMPEFLFLSGRNPPHRIGDKPRHQLSDEEFRQEIFSLGGTPREVMEQTEMFDFFLPILRADFRMIETYETQRSYEKLACKILVLHGSRDELASPSMVEEWSMYTEKGFQSIPFEGDHFFIHSQKGSVIGLINETLTSTATE